MGLRLISFDRPGYEESDRLEGRRIADVAGDVLAIADAYGLDKFGVVGRSGGGLHALACAALLSERTKRAAIIAGTAPRDLGGLDRFDRTVQSKFMDLTKAATGDRDIAAAIKVAAEAIQANPADLTAGLQAELPGPDRQVVADAAIRSMLIEMNTETLRTSAFGWIDDVLAIASPWGFEPASITIPVRFLCVQNIPSSQASSAQLLAERIPGATVETMNSVSQLYEGRMLLNILNWTVDPEPPTDGQKPAGHAFISYVREDSEDVDKLQQALEAAGVRVWRDTAELWPGENWHIKIQDAITHDALVFIACFSTRSVAHQKSYQYEELRLAIDQMRLRRPDVSWLIPIRFDDCDVPDVPIWADHSLASIQRADLFGKDSDKSTAKLVSAVLRILNSDPSA